MATIYTPFTEEQVKSINGFQNSKSWQPFTCPKCGDNLKATIHGMNCYTCGKLFQTWVHDFMADNSWKDVRGVYNKI